jgi:hypothetical protein
MQYFITGKHVDLKPDHCKRRGPGTARQPSGLTLTKSPFIPRFSNALASDRPAMPAPILGSPTRFLAREPRLPVFEKSQHKNLCEPPYWPDGKPSNELVSQNLANQLKL